MKNIIIAILLLLSISYSAQIKYKVDIRANKLFKSYTDYVDNKPIEGIKVKELGTFGTTIEVEKNGVIEKIKESKNPYTWFCNEQGILMRVFDGNLYYVIIDGPICYYVKKEQAWAGFNVNVTLNKVEDEIYVMPTGNEPYKEYYSETINGEIKVFKNSMFDEYLEKYGLKEQYEAEKLKREVKDSVLDYKNKEWRKKNRYKKLINEKMK